MTGIDELNLPVCDPKFDLEISFNATEANGCEPFSVNFSYFSPNLVGFGHPLSHHGGFPLPRSVHACKNRTLHGYGRHETNAEWNGTERTGYPRSIPGWNPSHSYDPAFSSQPFKLKGKLDLPLPRGAHLNCRVVANAPDAWDYSGSHLSG